MARETKRFRFGPFDLDAGQRPLLRDGNIVQLAPKASELLLVLVQKRGGGAAAGAPRRSSPQEYRRESQCPSGSKAVPFFLFSLGFRVSSHT